MISKSLCSRLTFSAYCFPVLSYHFACFDQNCSTDCLVPRCSPLIADKAAGIVVADKVDGIVADMTAEKVDDIVAAVVDNMGAGSADIVAADMVVDIVADYRSFSVDFVYFVDNWR